ncbi:DUF4376 domain-containing protein [Bacillus haynesii]|uniref:DUF4376 domain-containing protein n=1 Tax=Bacillus haynesii TaxID=1925021 RepID=UPI00227F6607|nr:hypothetical protein [Bacillus haynesii]MCY8668778.1 DUF4376 domain-containing protein [Bacillus haynesii]
MLIYVVLQEDGKTVDGWGTTESGMAGEISVDVPPDHDIFRYHPHSMIYEDGVLYHNEEVSLQMSKDAKDLELNAACQEAIVAGFFHTIDGVTYWFAYDREAQINFGDSRELLKDGIVSEIPWTVQLDGTYARISIDFEEMQRITMTIMKHKVDNISRYRDVLLPLVNKAETVEEVEAIHWEMDV